MKIYKPVIKFLFNNYCGLYYVVIFNKVYKAFRASRILMPYLIMYGVLSIIIEDGVNTFSLVDLIFMILLVPQIIMSFTTLLVREYMKEFALTKEDIDKIDKERQMKAHTKLKNS